MATTSFSESLRYGGRLFGFFLGAVLAGGGLLAVGAYLAVPEIQALIGSEAVETGPLAGGLVLATLGVATLVAGSFALTYKLIADAVARGTTQSHAIAETTNERDTASNTGRAGELGPSPGEQTALEYGPDQTVPDGTNASDADGSTHAVDTSGREQPQEQERSGDIRQTQFDRTPEQKRPPTTTAGNSPKQPNTETAETRERVSPSESHEHREQTAEEIAFGTDDSTASASESGETPEQRTPEQADDNGSETVGSTSADPLADRADDA